MDIETKENNYNGLAELIISTVGVKLMINFVIYKLHTINLIYDSNYIGTNFGIQHLDIFITNINTEQETTNIITFLENKNLTNLSIQYTWKSTLRIDDYTADRFENTSKFLLKPDINKLFDTFTPLKKFDLTREKEVTDNEFILIFYIGVKKINKDFYLSQKEPLTKCFIIDLPNYSSFTIYNSLMAEDVNMKDYLQEDENNIVFLTLLNNNTYQGFATDIESIYRRDSSIIIVECKEEGTAIKHMMKDNTIFDKWYVRLGLDEYNNNKGINLSKLNSIKEEFNNGNKIFFLSKERRMKTISTISNVIIENNTTYYKNIYEEHINTVSGVHCNDNTSINVYDEISVADINTFMGKTDNEKLDMIGNNMKVCKP